MYMLLYTGIGTLLHGPSKLLRVRRCMLGLLNNLMLVIGTQIPATRGTLSLNLCTNLVGRFHYLGPGKGPGLVPQVTRKIEKLKK